MQGKHQLFNTSVLIDSITQMRKLPLFLQHLLKRSFYSFLIQATTCIEDLQSSLAPPFLPVAQARTYLIYFQTQSVSRIHSFKLILSKPSLSKPSCQIQLCQNQLIKSILSNLILSVELCNSISTYLHLYCKCKTQNFNTSDINSFSICLHSSYSQYNTNYK